MKAITLLVGSVAGLVGAFSASSWLFSQSGNSLVSSGPTQPTALQLVASATVQGGQQMVVLDQTTKSLAVYLVDSAGNVQLRSVRSLVWDLRMEEFNAQSPTPGELKRVQP